MKKLLSVIAVIAIVMSLLTYFPSVAAEKTTYIKKIVSLVYDDSGSMTKDKWAYANYAVQSFCGMLNSEDQLYITYMSRAQLNPDYKPEKIELSSGGIQDSVDKLRAHDEKEDTPFRSVELAYNKLCEIECDDENAQYWLVVITDGVFDEIYYETSEAVKKAYLNDKFEAFAKMPMPNGSRVQTTFFSIGEDVAAPDHNESLGIFTYNAKSADEIIATMSKLAHKVSGRTEVKTENMEKSGENSIKITSSLPLLNIAVVSQKTDAVIERVRDLGSKEESGKDDLSVVRDVSVYYEGYTDLVGKTYLIGGSDEIIDEGTYELVFNKKTEPENLVVMLEPALEMRIFVESGGKIYDKVSDIEKITNGEKIKVSYKVYKIGDDTELPVEELPKGTGFNVVLYEDGKEVMTSSDPLAMPDEYLLTDKEVRIQASVEIDGFNPIGSKMTFVPTRYGSGDEFSIKGEYLGDNKGVKYSSISSNEDMGICFTVYEDGKPLTDPEKVKATMPEFKVTPEGNEGEITYTDDGRIIFTPKKAVLPSPDSERFNVGVSCTIGGNKTAEMEYTVMVSDYQMVVLSKDVSIVKTKFFGNEETVSFCVEKNGERLDKNSIGSDLEIDLGEEYSHLKADVKISDDGVITVRPYSEKEHKLTFFSWWSNWWHYFRLEGSDMNIKAVHPLCSAEASVDVRGESFLYRLLCVYIPLLITIAIWALIIAYIVCIITKPKFTDTAKLYMGTIRYNKADGGGHILTDFECVDLKNYNSLDKKNTGILKFSKKGIVASPGDILIRAENGGRITCEMAFPWYKGSIIPCDIGEEEVGTPELLAEYFERHRKLKIEEIYATDTINSLLEKSISPANARLVKYIVIPGDGSGSGGDSDEGGSHSGRVNGIGTVDGRSVILKGTIFIYKD